ncbi:MAG TPA: cyclic nucleotide-binding domain-containing protein [Thermoplasmata archaeon]|nr:cyclic nucleotide-binding domain-containing protein [Thermoplasmata archaeon]
MKVVSHTVPESRVLEHPFFSGMDPQLAKPIVAKAVERLYSAGEVLAEEGTPCEEFFLVYEGKVGLEVGAADRPRLTVQTVGWGELVGWSWLVPPYEWRFEARAVKPTRVVVLDAPTVRQALEANPGLGYQFLLRLLPVVAERLENARVQLLDIHGR